MMQHLKPHMPRSLSPIRGRKEQGSNTRSRSPLNNKKRALRSVSADRDIAYFNILGSEGLVGTGHILQEIELARTTSSITKLELEDVVCRKENTQEIFCAIQKLLQQEADRPWSNIRFADTIHIFAEHSDDQSSSRAMFQLMEYEAKQQALWELITTAQSNNGGSGGNLPLAFEAKIMMDEGTSIDSVLKLIKVLPNSSLERVEFGGGLFGFKEEDIPEKLTSLFLKVKALDANEETGYYTMEMIMIDLFYVPPHLQSKAQPQAVLPQCITKLTTLKTGHVPRRNGVVQDMTAMKGSSHNRNNTPPGSPKHEHDHHHRRRQRKDRFVKRTKSKEDPLGGTSHHGGGSRGVAPPRRRRIKRQNSLPETDPDKAFARKNSVELNLEKFAALRSSTSGTASSSSQSPEPGETKTEDVPPTHVDSDHRSCENGKEMFTQDDDNSLARHTSRERCSSNEAPTERSHGCRLKRQSSLPEIKREVLQFAQQNNKAKSRPSGYFDWTQYAARGVAAA